MRRLEREKKRKERRVYRRRMRRRGDSRERRQEEGCKGENLPPSKSDVVASQRLLGPCVYCDAPRVLRSQESFHHFLGGDLGKVAGLSKCPVHNKGMIAFVLSTL